MHGPRWQSTILALLAVALLTTCVVACPNCKEGLAQNDPQHQSVARGFYYSVLFMMSMPFAILGTFGGMAYVSIRRARTQQQAASVADDDTFVAR
jgi:heme/copper-type cytochrome/quinol oxidase subunit 2